LPITLLGVLNDSYRIALEIATCTPAAATCLTQVVMAESN
jgi:hypothetical protein